jgi:hypothetical protein
VALPGPVIEQIQALLHQIHSHDLAALVSFRGLRPSLVLAMGSAGVTALSAALEALDFSQAASLLQTGMKPSAMANPLSITITD